MQHVSQTYCKEGYLQKDFLRSYFSEIYSQCTKFGRVIKISQLLAFYFTTPFSGCLQRRISNTSSNICSGVFFAKILSSFKAAIFAKKLHHKCSTGLKTGFQLRVSNIELNLVHSLQIKPKKYSAGKYATSFLKRYQVKLGK